MSYYVGPSFYGSLVFGSGRRTSVRRPFSYVSRFGALRSVGGLWFRWSQWAAEFVTRPSGLRTRLRANRPATRSAWRLAHLAARPRRS